MTATIISMAYAIRMPSTTRAEHRGGIELTCRGVTMTALQWSRAHAEYGLPPVPRVTLLARKRSGWPDTRALMTPVQIKHRPVKRHPGSELRVVR
jgi:hypothetical protein